jgi:tRNA A-37 threonylcarbamoyl transferase component Bud32
MSEQFWTKTIPIINKKGVSDESNILKEIQIQKVASSYGFTPKIINVNKDDTNYYIQMENLNRLCLADIYGEEPPDLPEHFWNQMRCIVKLLYVREGIEYIDITPYNFIDIDDKIYLIDFGHARWKTSIRPINWFLKKFIGSEINEYNPDFK